MSKLLDRLKKEAAHQKTRQETRSGGEFKKTPWYKPKLGDQLIRILPHWEKPKDEVFYVQANLHYNVAITAKDGNEYKIPVRCLRDFNEDCPLCDAFEKLSRDDRKKQRSYRAAERYLYNIFDYPTKKHYVWATPMTVHQNVMEWIAEFDADVTNEESGRDLKIIKSEESGMTKYKVMPKMTESQFPAKAKKMCEVADLSELYTENHREAMNAELGIKPKKSKAKPKVEEVEEDDTEWPGDKGDFAEGKADMDIEDKDLEAELDRLGVS